ncbi:MAG: ABC transporter substrate-binding protein [Lachnospiraceae bacterium]|jgi:raffinose/stachyose/melibiose transport system substrate-binding protein
MRKNIKCGIILLLLAAAVGCGNTQTAEQQKERSKVTLTISLPEAEWSGYTEGLTALYQKTHPEIQDIKWNLVDRSMYSDLLNVSVASQNIPDMISVGYGDSLKLWKEQLVPLEESQFDQVFSKELLNKGKLKNTLYSIPVTVSARGILYNQRLLKEAGATNVPETRQEFQELCQKLEDAEIKPIMNHYKETLLTTTSQLFWVQMEQKDREESVNVLADFLDSTLLYGNRNALTTDGDTARNYFFIERYAMLNNEGTWMVPVLKKSAPELEKYVKIGPIPLYEEAEKNKFPIEILTLSVTKSSRHPEEAKEFLIWLSTSEDARDYLEGTMGILSVSGIQDERMDNLSPIASQIKLAALRGKAIYDSSFESSEEQKEKNGEIWGRYLTGEIDREQVMIQVQSLWQN